ncbi:MAG: GPW/gp25 family protein [Campylobacter sp.]|nr:GPW/gp25 family protein [Campylobacter sp.]MBR6611002.1 GPW/gp25 family protein [Campylobacter sp.]
MYQISIDENISRILKTTKFTKRLRPDFGLERYIDKRADLPTILDLKRELLEQLNRYEPRINPTKLTITASQKGFVDIDLEYEILESGVIARIYYTL